MGNKRWTRVLALVMALVCTLTVVAAVDFATLDLNNDGKVTVWDLQQWLGQDNYDAALKQVLGGKGDELNAKIVNGETVYEIWSEMGLRNMVKHAKDGATFELMANIDLGGKDWTPVTKFTGTFNGNGKKISNFKITEVSEGNSMGFFGSTLNEDADNRTRISDLHLEGVEIEVTQADVRFVGAVAGTNRGDIVNCTAVSKVVDMRSEIDQTEVYYGTIAGRNTQNSGTVRGTNEMVPVVNIAQDSLDDADLKKPEELDTRVNSMMATIFPENESKEEYTAQKTQRKVGIVGHAGGDTGYQNLLWQDLTNSTDLADPVLQQRREEAVAVMYELSTVEWTPSANSPVIAQSVADKGQGNGMQYFRYVDDQTDKIEVSQYFTGGIWSGNTWYAGGVYRGLPYNHGAGNMDKLQSVADLKNGVYVLKDSLPTEGYYITDSDIQKAINTAYTSGANTATLNGKTYTVPDTMSKALVVGTANNVGFNQYFGADCASQAAWAWKKISAVADIADSEGWVNPQATAELFPNSENIKKYNIVSVNGMTFTTKTASSHGDRSAEVSDALAADMEANNGRAEYFWDTLALTSKGDFLMEYSPAGGHTRVAMSDAVVIRNYKGVLDQDKSYIYTAEQGGSGTDSDGVNHYLSADMAADPWRSSCCVNRRMTFADLTTDTYNEDYDKYLVYFPITCDALRNADSAAATVSVNMDANGNVTSNFYIVSTTVGGTTVYNGVGQTGCRNAITSVTVTGDTNDDVIVRLANGKNYTGKLGTVGLTEVK